jgi:hypothetical protein
MLKLSLTPLEYILERFPKTHPQVARRKLGAFGTSRADINRFFSVVFTRVFLSILLYSHVITNYTSLALSLDRYHGSAITASYR